MINLYLIFTINLHICYLTCITAAENKEQHLNKLKSCLIQRGHPEVQDYAMTKLFSPSFKSQNESTDYMNFVQIYNPNTKFKKNINNSLNDLSP